MRTAEPRCTKIGFSASKLIVVPNGVDPMLFRPDSDARERMRRTWGVTAHEFLLGCVARWDPLKDHENLVRAVKLLAGRGHAFRCVLIGRGMNAENRELRRMMERWGIGDRFILAGASADVPAIMNALDLHVLPSRSESLPVAVMEAMACGTACVVTDVGDARHIVGDIGWVARPQDSAALADATPQFQPTCSKSELFGYEDGAFTGARKGGKVGKVQAADKGTLLLDEINELPLELQAKLLRVIQEREIDKLGGLKSIPVDFRLICSTNKSLPDLIAAKAFREDLYYRINVLEIFVPALRDRRDDIPLLVRHFIDRINADLGLHVERVDDDALELLQQYDWPGNVRQLAHALERAANLKGTGALSLDCFEHIRLRLEAEATAQTRDDGSLTTMLAEVEKARIVSALASAHGNKARAAKTLKVDRSVLYDKLKKYGLNQKEP